MQGDTDEIRYSSRIFNLSGSEIAELYEIVRKIRISLGYKNEISLGGKELNTNRYEQGNKRRNFA